MASEQGLINAFAPLFYSMPRFEYCKKDIALLQALPCRYNNLDMLNFMDCRNKKILIIKPSSLGDIFHTLPVAHALKRCFPSCRIGWVVQQAFSSLLIGDPAVDYVHAIDIPSTSEPGSAKIVWWQAVRSTLSALKQLRRECSQDPYDLILDLQASFRSGLLGRANPGGVRVGFADARELNTLFQDERIQVPPEIHHAVDKNILFCTHLHCSVEPEDFFITSSDNDQARVEQFLQQQGIANEESLIYANPCARWQTKFWPAEYWAALADRLHGAGYFLVFAGSRQDRDFINLISAQMQSKTYIAAGELGLTEAVALMQRSVAYIGLDTGPMHMAAISGTPVVALFGPTHPERVGPYGVKNVIVRCEGLACLECRKRQCDHMSCMRGLKVKQVEAALMSLLTPATKRKMTSV